MAGPLNISIVGCGLAGLMAGLRLSRDGHSITVYERRTSLSSRGGGIMIRSNATRHLLDWALQDLLEGCAEKLTSATMRDLKSGNVLKEVSPQSSSQYPIYGTLRQRLQAALFTEVEKAANVEIRFGFQVVNVRDSADRACQLQFADGRVAKADLVNAADGVHSRLRDMLFENESHQRIKPRISTLTTYQTQPPLRNVLANVVAREAAAESGTIVWIDKKRHVVRGAARKADFVIADYIVDESESVGSSVDDKLWEKVGDIEYVRSIYTDACPTVQALLDDAKTCSRWELCDLPDLETWTSSNGRMILLGDSAHAMLPSGAQCLSMIAEDVAALAVLVDQRHMLTTPGEGKDGLSMATALWQKIRKPRVERIKAASYAAQMRYQSSNEDVSDQPAGEREGGEREADEGMNTPFASDAFKRWQYDYDVVAVVKEVLASGEGWSLV